MQVTEQSSSAELEAYKVTFIEKDCILGTYQHFGCILKYSVSLCTTVELLIC